MGVYANDELLKKLPIGVGTGVSVFCGLPDIPGDLEMHKFGYGLVKSLIKEAYDSLNVSEMCAEVLPTGLTLPGLGLVGTSGFPLAAPDHPAICAFNFSSKFLSFIDGIDPKHRVRLGRAICVLADTEISITKRQGLPESFLGQFHVYESSSKLSRRIFEGADQFSPGKESKSEIVMFPGVFNVLNKHLEDKVRGSKKVAFIDQTGDVPSPREVYLYSKDTSVFSNVIPMKQSA